MKHRIHTFIIIILLVSCSDSNTKKEKNPKKETSKSIINREHFHLKKNSDNTLNEWVNYYQSLESNFSLERFEFYTKDTLIISEGNVYGNYEANFDPIYSEFLIYRADKEKYIDFDSYNWTVNENNKVDFSPDQEINIIDVKNKTVNRIAFRGPSQWVENAFWQNDSTIVLLENNYNRQPNILKFNLNNNSYETFIYGNTLNFESEYPKMRLKQKGLSFE